MTTQAPEVTPEVQKAVWRAIRDRHPRLREALAADARVTALHRGERHQFRSPLDTALQVARLAWSSDAFLAPGALPREGAPPGARGADPAAPRPPPGDDDRPDLDRRSGRRGAGRLHHPRPVRRRRADRDPHRRGDRPVRDDRAARGRRSGRDDRAERQHRHRREGHRRGPDRRRSAGRSQRRGGRRRARRGHRGRLRRPVRWGRRAPKWTEQDLWYSRAHGAIQAQEQQAG